MPSMRSITEKTCKGTTKNAHLQEKLAIFAKKIDLSICIQYSISHSSSLESEILEIGCKRGYPFFLQILRANWRMPRILRTYFRGGTRICGRCPRSTTKNTASLNARAQPALQSELENVPHFANVLSSIAPEESPL